MKKFLSKSLELNVRLSINQLLALHTYQKNYQGHIYLLFNHDMITLESLPSLVSFSLTMNPRCEIQLIVEGENPQQTLNDLTKCIHLKEHQIAR
ncbi:hypothetical protein [Gracilibacillus thailandensis]|uniref:HPr family phosphocarrier protein n=1 Tax=Gracilibacillus thailandensis TaxID=563735 RepID=A0A6N7R3N5_9BACI|nr:hypothetical protein [Gracilibacillus thailandensis]MRI67817.1 hypothetical protein [Gracilibacillus thailandensis]